MKEKKHLKSPVGDILHFPDKYTITMKGGSVSLVYSGKGLGQAGWKSLASITPKALENAVASGTLAAFFKPSETGTAEKTVKVGEAWRGWQLGTSDGYQDITVGVKKKRKKPASGEKKYLQSPAGETLKLPNQYALASTRDQKISLMYSYQGEIQKHWKSLAYIRPTELKEAVEAGTLDALLKHICRNNKITHDWKPWQGWKVTTGPECNDIMVYKQESKKRTGKASVGLLAAETAVGPKIQGKRQKIARDIPGGEADFAMVPVVTPVLATVEQKGLTHGGSAAKVSWNDVWAGEVREGLEFDEAISLIC